jgi:hypothetical protein
MASDPADFLSEFLAPSQPIAKDLTYNGKTGKVYFRRITAGERAQLLKGQRIQRKAGEEGTSYDIDLAETEKGKAQLVFFSAVTPDGKQRFSSLGQVLGAEQLLVGALYDLATQVNREHDDEGDDAAGKA